MMVPPFNRRDSARYALSTAATLAALVAVVAYGRGWRTSDTGLAALAAAGGTVLLFAALTWHLPDDLPLRRLGVAEGRSAAARPAPSGGAPSGGAPGGGAPGVARLRIALRRETLALGRMDVFIDGARVGQLYPGAALVLPLPPGAHVLSARVWLRRLDLQEQINALPGTDSDFSIEASGSKLRQYGIDRHGVEAALRDPRTIVLAAGPPG